MGPGCFTGVLMELREPSPVATRARDDGTGPKVRGQLDSFGKEELWQEQGKDHQDFRKGDGPQEISSCSEPLGAFTFLSTFHLRLCAPQLESRAGQKSH